MWLCYLHLWWYYHFLMNLVELGNALVYSASAMGKHLEHIIPTFHYHCLSTQGRGKRWCVKKMKYLYFILLCSYIFKPIFVFVFITWVLVYLLFFLIVFLLGRCHHAGGACLQRGCWPSDRLTDVGKKWQDNPPSLTPIPVPVQAHNTPFSQFLWFVDFLQHFPCT